MNVVLKVSVNVYVKPVYVELDATLGEAEVLAGSELADSLDVAGPFELPVPELADLLELTVPELAGPLEVPVAELAGPLLGLTDIEELDAITLGLDDPELLFAGMELELSELLELAGKDDELDATLLELP